MNLYLSTNLYNTQNLGKVLHILDAVGSQDLGVELFPTWHEEAYESVLQNMMDRLKNLPISFHGPYYFTEHSAPKGTEEYKRAMEYFQKTLVYAKELGSNHIVFHHNNCQVKAEDKEKLKRISSENLLELNNMASEQQVEILVENVGVASRKNVLFDEQEFIDMCLSIENRVLIDIGHAHCNGWNLGNVMDKLKDKIAAYHLHNNYGYDDEHNRIFDGTLDFNVFLEDYKKFTPNADLVVEYSAQLCDREEDVIEDINYLINYFVKQIK